MIKEHDMVRLMHYIKGIPENAIGTVVHVYAGNKAYEVEFSGCWHPCSHVRKTLGSNEIERVPNGLVHKTT